MAIELAFDSAPDQSGSGNFVVSATGLPEPVILAMYGVDSEGALPQVQLLNQSTVLNASSVIQTWPPSASPLAAYLAVVFNSSSSPPTDLDISTIASNAAILASAAAQVPVPAAELQTILDAGVEFGERIQSGTLKRSTSEIPSTQESIDELIDLGVPAAYMTPFVVTNLAELLNELQVGKDGKVSPKAGALKCWACKVGFGIAILVVVTAVVVVIMIATGGAGLLANAIVPILLKSSIAVLSNNAFVVGGAIAAGTWTGGTAAICGGLLEFIPKKLCELTGDC